MYILKKLLIPICIFVFFVCQVSCSNKDVLENETLDMTETSENEFKRAIPNKYVKTFDLNDDVLEKNDIENASKDIEVVEDENNYLNEINIEKDFPRVDGSTANIPLLAKIRSSYLNEDYDVSEKQISVSTTDMAWRNLLDGNIDLIIAYEPSEETKDIINKSKDDLLIKPIGRDALVFLVNKMNDISNIKSDDLRKIYAGEITNWKEVGGKDYSIIPFQRQINSGSQTLFLNIFMKDTIPMTPYMDVTQFGDMSTLIDKISEFDNGMYSVGYSVYYYAKKMVDNPNVKILSIDGIQPNDETIFSGKYEYVNNFYVAIRKDDMDNQKIFDLYSYILGPKGINNLSDMGYVPIIK